MLGALLLQSAWAFGLAISPPYFDLDVRSGAVTAERVTVTNTTAEPVEVRAYLTDLWYTPEGHAFPPVGTLDRSAAVFSSVEPEHFALGVGEKKPVELQIRVPAEARGGYYATLFFEAAVPGAARASMRMGSLVLVDTGGVASPIVTLGVPTVRSTPSGLVVGVPAHLDGETHRFLTLKAVVRDVTSNRVVGRVESLPVRFLPGQDRMIEATLDRALDPATYQIDGVVLAPDLPPVPVSIHHAHR